MANLIPYDDRDGLIWLDGQLVDWRSAKIHVLSHALHYASAVFEGERAYEGRIFKLRPHTDRLFFSAEQLGFEIPYSRDEIDAACNAVIKANKILDGYVRPIAWRGPEQMGVAAQQTKIHVAVAAWQWPRYFGDEARTKGIKLTVSEWRRPAPDTAPVRAKAAGLYMICTLSKHKAEAKGYHDALMCDWRGQLAEATGANVFIAKNGALHTPTADCFLDGITRRTVMDLARKRGISVTERAIMPGELATADEVFLTGTAAEVTPVGEIDQYNYQVGPITRSLMADYDALVRQPS